MPTSCSDQLKLTSQLSDTDYYNVCSAELRNTTSSSCRAQYLAMTYYERFKLPPFRMWMSASSALCVTECCSIREELEVANAARAVEIRLCVGSQGSYLGWIQPGITCWWNAPTFLPPPLLLLLLPLRQKRSKQL